MTSARRATSARMRATACAASSGARSASSSATIAGQRRAQLVRDVRAVGALAGERLEEAAHERVERRLERAISARPSGGGRGGLLGVDDVRRSSPTSDVSSRDGRAQRAPHGEPQREESPGARPRPSRARARRRPRGVRRWGQPRPRRTLASRCARRRATAEPLVQTVRHVAGRETSGSTRPGSAPSSPRRCVPRADAAPLRRRRRPRPAPRRARLPPPARASARRVSPPPRRARVARVARVEHAIGHHDGRARRRRRARRPASAKRRRVRRASSVRVAHAYPTWRTVRTRLADAVLGELAANARDEHLEARRRALARVAPHGLEELVPRHDAAVAPREERDDVELARA